MKLCCRVSSVKKRMGEGTYLASTASTFALVKLSTPTNLPRPSVKNPTQLTDQQQSRNKNEDEKRRGDVPLIPARIVELPTLVNPRLALTLQFAANHAKQNTAARDAVSLVESFSCTWCVEEGERKRSTVAAAAAAASGGGGIVWDDGGWCRLSAGDGDAERMREFARPSV